MFYLWRNRTLCKKLYSGQSKKKIFNMYQQLELLKEVDIVSVANNDTAKDNNICSIFSGEDINFIDESNLLEFN